MLQFAISKSLILNPNKIKLISHTENITVQCLLSLIKKWIFQRNELHFLLILEITSVLYTLSFTACGLLTQHFFLFLTTKVYLALFL